jgi:hypothetical protein
MSVLNYVKITRPNGSVFYRGPWRWDRCLDETLAWARTFHLYETEILDADKERKRFEAWESFAEENPGKEYFPS